MSDSIRISVDAMGGDKGPRAAVHGARLFWRERKNTTFIFHGRQVCIARRPRCGECVLARLCPSSLV